MASFRSKFQISNLLTSNNKYNLLLRQRPWHCFQPILCFNNINNEEHCHDCKKLMSAPTSDPKSCGLKRKMRFLNLRRMSSTKIKNMPIVNRKVQKSPKRKLTLWEYVFGPDHKKSQVDPRTCRLAHCRLAHCQKQAHRVKDPRLRDPRYQKTAGDVLIYTESVGSLKESKSEKEPQPKPPPAYKMPKAVLLDKMTKEFKENEKNYEDAIVTSTAPIKSCSKAIKPFTDEKIAKYPVVISENINEKSISRPISIRKNAVRDSTVKVLRQAMAQEEPRGLSRIEKLKTVMSEKMFKS